MAPAMQNDVDPRAIQGATAPGAATDQTIVALKAEIANWRWAGVPFYLRTGKRLPARLSEIVVTFRPVPHSVFAPAMAGPSS